MKWLAPSHEGERAGLVEEGDVRNPVLVLDADVEVTPTVGTGTEHERHGLELVLESVGGLVVAPFAGAVTETSVVGCELHLVLLVLVAELSFVDLGVEALVPPEARRTQLGLGALARLEVSDHCGSAWVELRSLELVLLAYHWFLSSRRDFLMPFSMKVTAHCLSLFCLRQTLYARRQSVQQENLYSTPWCSTLKPL